MKTRHLILVSLVAAAAMTGTTAYADGLAGTWLRETGASKVRFSSCGSAMCGSISWIQPGIETPAKVGQRVFINMKADGANTWSGTAFNPEDGKTYAGKASLSGNSLTTQGCVMGGMICKSTSWTRSN